MQFPPGCAGPLSSEISAGALFLIPVVLHAAMLPLMVSLPGGVQWQNCLTPKADGLYHTPASWGWGTLTTEGPAVHIMLNAAHGKYLKDSATSDKDIALLSVGYLVLLLSGVALLWRGIKPGPQTENTSECCASFLPRALPVSSTPSPVQYKTEGSQAPWGSL